MSKSSRDICGGCLQAPVRAPGQFYCQKCQNEKDTASARSRRAELKALRAEVADLRKRLSESELELSSERERSQYFPD